MWKALHQLAIPERLYRPCGCWIPWLAALSALLLVIGLGWGFGFAPADYQQGESYRIMYLHVPAAMWSMGLYLAMAVAAHIVMQVGTRHGARRTVPDFSGVKLDQAQRMARKYDLKLHINDSLFVPAYEGGIVLDQLPEGGVEVKPGRTVYITINSFRQKMVPVPYVAGRSLRQAKNMLEIAGLEIAELVYRADMATNYVLDEYCDGRPVAATSKIEAELGSGVTLYVGVEGGYGTTVVPRLVGFPLKEAKCRPRRSRPRRPASCRPAGPC